MVTVMKMIIFFDAKQNSFGFTTKSDVNHNTVNIPEGGRLIFFRISAVGTTKDVDEKVYSQKGIMFLFCHPKRFWVLSHQILLNKEKLIWKHGYIIWLKCTRLILVQRIPKHIRSTENFFLKMPINLLHN
jgi:hypothetical protein